MSANDEEINRREVAWRLFASEFRDADFSYAESDEERAPNYVVTPTGARVNRLFVVGVLTEIEYVSDDYLRARIVDPTGAFVVYAGQYQPEALTFLENAETPTFVAVTGKARTFQPDDSDVVYTSIRPEAISEVDAASRDNWVVTTAEQTLERVATMADALDLVERGDDLRAVLEARHVPQGLAAGIPLAIDHYDTTGHYLAAIRDVSLDAARVVSGDREEVEQYRIDPNEEGDEPIDLGLEEFTLVTGDAQPVTTTESEAAEPEAAEPSADVDEEATAETEVDEGEVVETETEETEPEKTETEEVEAAAVGASSGTTESEPAESEAEPDEESEAETEPASTADSTAETERPDESETVDEPQVESEAQSAEAETETDAEAEAEAVDTDEMYELSEEERKEVEENYDVEFSTADEVDGTAGIEPETPEPETDAAEAEEPEVEDAAEETAEDLAFDAETDEEAEETAAEFEAEHEDGEDAEPSDEESEGTTTENLEDAVVETMQSLGDGDGADRDELVQTIMEEHGVDQDAVEDAIQDALMSGRCYESGDNELTAI